MSYSRRSFFSYCGRAVVNELAATCGAVRELTSGGFSTLRDDVRNKWLRPPGAVAETSFLEACTRCTACQKACPHQSIRRLGPEFGSAAGTPVIIPEESPCYLCEDLPCIAACEPMALQRVSRSEITMGSAVIRQEGCYVAQGQPCDYCVSRCPLKDEAIGFNTEGLPEVNNAACAGCGVCAYLCPADAIVIR